MLDSESHIAIYFCLPHSLFLVFLRALPWLWYSSDYDSQLTIALYIQCLIRRFRANLFMVCECVFIIIQAVDIIPPASHRICIGAMISPTRTVLNRHWGGFKQPTYNIFSIGWFTNVDTQHMQFVCDEASLYRGLSRARCWSLHLFVLQATAASSLNARVMSFSQ